MGKDRFLVGILVGIGVLVAVALTLFFVRQGQVDYGDDSTPAGALQNYFLAIQKHDYEKAYSYLADQYGKPSLSQFREPFLSYLQENVSGTAVEVDQTIPDAQNQTAIVKVNILNSTRDIFGTAVRRSDTATLVNQDGAWKVLNAPYPYGYPDLYQKIVTQTLPPPSPTPTIQSTGTAP